MVLISQSTVSLVSPGDDGFVLFGELKTVLSKKSMNPPYPGTEFSMWAEHYPPIFQMKRRLITMKIVDVVCSKARTGFFFDDQRAIKQGAVSEKQ